jgi:hypothetical protein
MQLPQHHLPFTYTGWRITKQLSKHWPGVLSKPTYLHLEGELLIAASNSGTHNQELVSIA